MNISTYEAECSSPKDLGMAMVEVLKPKVTDKIYDPAAGRVGFLLAAKNFIERNEGQPPEAKNFFAREINRNVFLSSKARLKENGLDGAQIYNENSLTTGDKDAEVFDVVISHPPFGLKVKNIEGKLGIKSNDSNNQFLQSIISSLKSGGRAAVVVSNSFFSSSSQDHIALRKYLLSNCNLHTVLELPQKTFEYTNIGASVLFFKKGLPTESIGYFLKAIDEDYGCFLDFIQNGTQKEGSYIFDVNNLDEDKYALPTATSLAIKQEVLEKSKNFKYFKCYKIDELCLEINMTSDRLEERENAVYLSKTKAYDCVESIEETTLKHQNYFQLVLNKQTVLKGYFSYYIKSPLGQMILNSCFTGTAIPRISKASLKDNLKIYVPSLGEQNLIAATFKELASVKSLMEKTAFELSSDPNAARHILNKLQDTKEAFNDLSEEEKILKLIKGGENLHVEFKETLSKNTHTGKKDKDIQSAVLKNIVGFLNKSGGKLLVGVSDEGVIKGIEEDYYKNDDQYKLTLSSLINDKIGAKEANFIDYKIHTVHSKKICLINCKKSSNPSYLDGDFYVRTDPECRKLSAKEANDYIREHFQ